MPGWVQMADTFRTSVDCPLLGQDKTDGHPMYIGVSVVRPVRARYGVASG